MESRELTTQQVPETPFTFHERSNSILRCRTRQAEFSEMYAIFLKSMNLSASIPVYMETTEPSIPASTRGLRWYLAGFLATPLLVLGLTLWAATQPWFMQHDNYDFGRIMGYSLRAKGLGCKVVLYGDSTAMAGLDPKLIETRTGLKTCNVAEIRPVQDTVGVSFPLDQYLGHNPPPKYLVTSWTPATFNFDRPPMFLPRQDGYLYALQYDRGAWFWKGAITHPSTFLSFLDWALSSIIEDAFKSLVGKSVRQTRPDLRAIRDQNAGMFTFTNIPERQCSPPDRPPPTTLSDNLRGAGAFRKRYETKDTHVIVDVSPIANCVPNLEELRSLTIGVVDNQFSALPVENFDIDNTHLVRAGAEAFSEEVSSQILSLMKSEPARREPVHSR